MPQMNPEAYEFASKRKRDIYNYENTRFASLREPMRAVMEAYGEAERFFAATKEVVWGKFGCKHLSDKIHKLEHLQPERVDEFKAILAQYGLEVEYPPVGELIETFDDLDRVFEICVSLIDTVDYMLMNFIRVCQNTEFESMARQAEQLQIDNSKDRTWLLEAWSMWDNDVGVTSFDNWVEDMED